MWRPSKYFNPPMPGLISPWATPASLRVFVLVRSGSGGHVCALHVVMRANWRLLFTGESEFFAFISVLSLSKVVWYLVSE